MSNKLKAQVYADQRVGFPDILEYELVEGPKKGQRQGCPPTFATDPHPDPRGIAKDLGTPHLPIRPGCAYVTIVHDLDAYEDLKAKGFWSSKEHTGHEMFLIDNRRAPR